MNGRLESRPTGRLESLPYESAPSVFFAFSAVKKIPVFFLGGDARPQPDLLPQEKGRAFTRFYYSIACRANPIIQHRKLKKAKKLKH